MRYTINDNGCWEWNGNKTTDGYGVLTIEGKPFRAHRAMYLLHVGMIPKNLMVRHTCDNPSCVNPEHLVIGTAQDNMNDKVARNRQSFLKGVNNGNAHLSEKQVIEIYNSNKSCSKLGEEYGVSRNTIWKIKSGKTWVHLTKKG